ncbi:MAG: hypothetical protein QNJ74_30055 [Trichodesmium sp. MO_231.B1]|nr:hypothetical protein [Trichodesmium sp. MO_231.B1]
MTDNVNTSAIETYDPKKESVEILEVVSDGLSKYLKHLGLPHKDILVQVKQRQRAILNIQEIIPDLSSKQKESAFYLSKFISALMMGLFDAALNYLWDETIQNLRRKVAIFDIGYFYDTAIKDTKKRTKFKDEQDLVKLDDWELVAGCEETGIITQLGYKHLDYIRDMRNHASAAHPNHNEITGLQLASWLETCIQEVIGKEPEGAVIEVKKLLKSLREENLSKNDISPISEGIRKLPEELIHSLLRNVFGMYTDVDIDANIRRNINLIAQEIWKASAEEVRYEIGLKYSSFEINGEVSRKRRASDFLENVQGLSYLPDDTLALKLNEALDALFITHNGWNNFHNEPTPAKLVESFIPSSGKIPKSSIMNYVRVLTICRIGNEYGVSNAAQEIYDNLIAQWSNDEAKCLIKLLAEDYKLLSKLQFSSCQKEFKNIISNIYPNITEKLIKDMFDFIKDFPANRRLNSIPTDKEFKQRLDNLKV